MKFSKADMSQYVIKDEPKQQQQDKTQLLPCPRCSGKGYVMQTTSFDNTTANAYYDAKGNLKTETIKTGSRDYTSKVRCPQCNGSGKVPQ